MESSNSNSSIRKPTRPAKPTTGGRGIVETPASSSSSSSYPSFLDLIPLDLDLVSPIPLSPSPQLPSPSTSKAVDSLIQATLSSTPKKVRTLSSSSSSDGVIDPLPVVPKKKVKRSLKTDICTHEYKRGSKKGQRCTRRVGSNELMCSQHKVHLSKEDSAAIEAAKSSVVVEYSKLRFNRLKGDTKYYFIKKLNTQIRFIVVQLDDKYYKVKLPKRLPIPDGKGWYLFRQMHQKDVVWRSD